MTPWRLPQIVFLVNAYKDMPLKELVAGVAERGEARTVNAIHARARSMMLKRNNPGWFSKKHRPQNRADTAPLRDAVIKLLAERQELTVNQVIKETGSRKSSVWRVFADLRMRGNAHVVRYQFPTPQNLEAVYRIGLGVDAPKPWQKSEPVPILIEQQDAAPQYEPQEVPRPKLGPWGLSWNTTQQTQEAA